MIVLAAISILGLLPATSGVSNPGYPKLKESAVDILVYAESKGADVFTGSLFGKHTENGRTVYDPMVMMDLHNFLQTLLLKLTDFKYIVRDNSTVSPGPQLKTTTPVPRRRRRHSYGSGNGGLNLTTSWNVVLPPGSELFKLDYNDILDIIGDYTKGFADIIVPNPMLYMDRDEFMDKLNALVDNIIGEIKEIISM